MASPFTTLSPIALPGRRYSFVAKTAATVPLAPASTVPIRRVRSADGTINRVPVATLTLWDLVLLNDWEDMTWDEIEAITFGITSRYYTVVRRGA